MRKTNLIFLVLVSVIFILKFLDLGKTKDNNQSTEPEIKTEIEAEITNVNFKALSKQPNKPSTKQSKKTTPSPTTNAFDDDPIVNIAIYSAKHGACFTITAMEKYQEENKSNQYMVKWTPAQKQYIEQTKTSCLAIKEQYPEFFIFDKNSSASYKINKPQSLLAEYLDFNKFSFTDNESKDYLTTIGQSYPDLIPNSLMRTRQYNKTIVLPILKDLIQSENDSYIYKIENFASTLLACQQDANCDNTSQIMNQYCLMEENFCVRDFMALYNTRLTPGIKADIQLALNYLKTIYN